MESECVERIGFFLAFRGDVFCRRIPDRRCSVFLFLPDGGFFYLQVMALFRWVCPVSAGIVVIQLAVCIPLFVWTCFVWVGCLAELMIVGILSYVIWIKWKVLWK